MPARLVALAGGPDIVVDRALVLVGRHPRCDVRLGSCRVSRIHCCLTRDRDEIFVRDLVSTNGTQINGLWAENGRLQAGDELSIAHFRYRLEVDQVLEFTPLCMCK
jgi:pSer/pThr/pTyr-binding forkhead associated (FHA) protein